MITGKTKKLAIIGYPISHSMSSVMQNKALEKLGLDYVYVPFSVHPDSLEKAITGFRNIDLEGFNVTIPHKVAIIPLLDELDVSAKEAGAVNVVVRRGEKFIGYNTDGDGLIKAISEEFNFSFENKKVIVLGAGGAARGAIASFYRKKVSEIVIINRTIGKAREIKSLYADKDIKITVYGENEDFAGHYKDANLLINTTSVGMNNDRHSHIDLSKLNKKAIVYDMVYSPKETSLLKDAKEYNLRCSNGLSMLAGQGEIAFSIWTSCPAPVGLMLEELNKRV